MLFEVRRADSLCTVEKLMPGLTGQGSAAAAYAIADALHARTAEPTLIDGAWLDKWVHKPVGLLRQLQRGRNEVLGGVPERRRQVTVEQVAA